MGQVGAWQVFKESKLVGLSSFTRLQLASEEAGGN